MAFHISYGIEMDSRAMPFPFSHSPRSPRLLSWKDALPWVPPWSLEQRAAPLPGIQGTWAPLSVSRSGLGDLGLNLRWDENPREQPEDDFPARAEEFAWSRIVGKTTPARNPRFHSRLYFPASLFLNIRDFIQEMATPRIRLVAPPAPVDADLSHSPPFASLTPRLRHS